MAVQLGYILKTFVYKEIGNPRESPSAVIVCLFNVVVATGCLCLLCTSCLVVMVMVVNKTMSLPVYSITAVQSNHWISFELRFFQIFPPPTLIRKGN